MSIVVSDDLSVVFFVFRAVMDLFWFAAGLCHCAALAVFLVAS
ncbi:MAG: hypothetical protein ABSC71_14850 [Candidatus Acidiferrales bacterium]|jgi:hypothetical protein